MASQSPNKPLQLLAQDGEDLSIIASALQDALIPAGDLRFLKDERQFLGLFNRFCWEQAGSSASDAEYLRCHAALRFDQVERVQFKGLDWSDPERILSLLTVAYDPASKAVALHFSGGAAVRLIVEELKAALSDLGEPWPTQWKPQHDPDATAF